MFGNRPVGLVLTGLLLLQAGCVHTWQPIDLSELPEHKKVRVNSIAVGSTEVYGPSVEADSLKGTAGTRLKYAIPLAGVKSVEAKLPSTGPTAGTWAAIALGTAAVAGTVWVMSCTETGSLGGLVWTC